MLLSRLGFKTTQLPKCIQPINTESVQVALIIVNCTQTIVFALVQQKLNTSPGLETSGKQTQNRTKQTQTPQKEQNQANEYEPIEADSYSSCYLKIFIQKSLYKSLRARIIQHCSPIASLFSLKTLSSHTTYTIYKEEKKLFEQHLQCSRN